MTQTGYPPPAQALWLAVTAALEADSLVSAQSLRRYHWLPLRPARLVPCPRLPAHLFGVLFASAAVPLGAALEFAQRLIPGRSFEPRDMLAETLGVCAGLALAAVLRSNR